MLYSGILYINSKISPKNVRYKRSTKVARARKVVERSLLSSKGPEAPVLHEGRARARARARAKYPGHFRPAKKRPHQWIFEFFLRDWLELDEILPIIATKNQKIEENLRKKFVSKIAKSEQIASNCCFLPLKIEEKLKKNLHCLAVRTEIRTGNFFILPKIADHRPKYRLSNKSLTGGSLRILTYSV